MTGRLSTMSPLLLQPIDIGKRGIEKSSMQAYEAGVDDNNQLMFPFYQNGMLVGYKVRKAGKQFSWLLAGENRVGDLGLWGWHAAKGRRLAIVTEGYEDAIAAYGYTGYTCLSLPGSAESGIKHLTNDLEKLEQFEKVIILFDNDGPGQNAAQACLDIIEPGKAAIAHLPPQFKDVSDLYKVTGNRLRSAQILKDALSAAKVPEVEGFTTGENLITEWKDFLANPDKRKGRSTGFEGLDDLIGGMREGEIITIIADSGVGKSTFTRNLGINAIENDGKVMLITVEDSVGLGMSHFMGMKTGQNMTRQDWTMDSLKALDEDASWIAERLVLMDSSSFDNLDVFFQKVRYGVRKGKPNLVVLDHITAIAERFGNESSTVSTILSNFQAYANQFNTTFVLVTHTSLKGVRDRGKNKLCPGIYDAKHSSSIAQVSAPILSLGRHKSGLVCCQVEKAARAWSKRGSVWFSYDDDGGRFHECPPPPPDDDESGMDQYNEVTYVKPYGDDNHDVY